MGQINVLSFEIANLIAAGEVVDRPASVVKELLENALDSGARAITVEIKNGGVSFIRVTDNGCGMEYSDLPIAIKRHATSKIHEADDLGKIMTLGFRGEALAAIAAVSHLRIYSKQSDASLGAMIEADGGNVLAHEQVGCADGTTVIIEDLFAHVPARKKFLKKNATEASACVSVAEKIALSTPDVSVKCIVDGEIKFSTAGDGVLKNAIYAVLGRDFAGKLAPVSREEFGLSLTGFIGTPENVRANRNFEYVFINGRYVKSRTAMAALEQAFVSYIPSDRFPVCVMDIHLQPDAVDVNVHPAKLEVKFSNEKLIFDLIYYAVRTTLEQHLARPAFTPPFISRQKRAADAFVPLPTEDQVKPSQEKMHLAADVLPQNPSAGHPGMAQAEPIKGSAAGSGFDYTLPNFEITGPNTPPPTRFSVRAAEELKSADVQASEKSYAIRSVELFPKSRNEENDPLKLSDTKVHAGEPTSAENDETDQDAQPVPEFILVGELYDCYVIIQLEDRILMIDKHAAHERILFEQMRANMRRAKHTGQMLLVPLTVSLETTVLDILREYEEEITAIGFRYTVDAAAHTAIVTQIPDGISMAAAGDMLETIGDRVASGEGSVAATRDELFTQALYQASCKAAIKGGRAYDRAHVEWICRELLRLPDIKYCPHGRPVAYEITKRELDRQFGRIK